MQIKNTQELPDRSLTFEGTLSAKEVATVVSVGLNTLWSNGLMRLIEDIEVTEIPNGDTTVQ